MSIASELTALQGYIGDAYDAVDDKGGTVPANKNMSNLSTAIDSIPSGGGVGIPREVDANGVYGMPTQSLSFSPPSNTTNVGAYALGNAFRGCTSLTTVDFSSLTTISGESALTYAFYGCTSLSSADFSSLTTISGDTVLNYAFYGCSSLTTVDFSSLTTISGNAALNYAFYGCSSLTTVDFSSLTTLSNSSAFSDAFEYCTSLTTVDFSSLTNAGINTFSYAFNHCENLTTVKFDSLSDISKSRVFGSAFNYCSSLTSLSFPALTPNSFGTKTNQFSSMLKFCTGVTVHFPAAIQSTIGSWSDVTNGFDGTNTTVLFDL